MSTKSEVFELSSLADIECHTLNYFSYTGFPWGAFSNWWWCPPQPNCSLCVFQLLALDSNLFSDFFWPATSRGGPVGIRSGHGRVVSSVCWFCPSADVLAFVLGLCSKLCLLPCFPVNLWWLFLDSAMWQCHNTQLWFRSKMELVAPSRFIFSLVTSKWSNLLSVFLPTLNPCQGHTHENR